MIETMQRLKIARRADFYALPEGDQRAHLAHARNEGLGLYVSDVKPLPDFEVSSTQADGSKPVDAIELMASIVAHKHDPPTQAQVDNARMLLGVPGLPEVFTRGARETLELAGELA